jgi:hypothetical protein
MTPNPRRAEIKRRLRTAKTWELRALFTQIQRKGINEALWRYFVLRKQQRSPERSGDH